MSARKVIDQLFEAYREGDYVRLPANKAEGWPEEFGTIVDVEGGGMFVVQLDDKYIEDGDDGVREVEASDIRPAVKVVKPKLNAKRVTQAKTMMTKVKAWSVGKNRGN